jgi:hypothetical protein
VIRTRTPESPASEAPTYEAAPVRLERSGASSRRPLPGRHPPVAAEREVDSHRAARKPALGTWTRQAACSSGVASATTSVLARTILTESDSDSNAETSC